MERTKEPPSQLIYSFGPFQLDPAERRLVRDGRELRLPPKVFETLVVLVRRHGLLVEKDDLMKVVWPGMFVEEATLAGNISLLRKALGEASGQDETQYIETVSKRGYRFIAKVTEAAPPAASSGGPQEEGPGGASKDGWQNIQEWTAGPGSRAARIAWGAASVLLCALVATGIAYIKLKNAASADTVVRSTIQPPADHQFAIVGPSGWDPVRPLNTSTPAVSEDGKQLVSPVRDTQGRFSLWLRGLNDAGEGRMLPGTEGAADPFWSPDGRSIGFFAGGKLKRIESDGSGLRILCDAPVERGGAWSPGGVILFAPSFLSPLYEIPANGGTPRRVTNLNIGGGEAGHRWPTFLADGRHFLFFVRSVENPEIAGIYAGSLDSQDYHLVVRTLQGPAFEARGTILYVRDGAVVAQPFHERKLVTTGEPTVLPDRVIFTLSNSRAGFSASRTGVLAYNPARPGGAFAVNWYERDGRHGDPLYTGEIYAPALSPDGTQAIVTIRSPDAPGSDLWSFDLSRGTKTRLTSGPGYKQYAVWQPDGRFVLFDSYPPDLAHIFRIKSDGTGAREKILETPGVYESPWSVCRDGRYLAYLRTPKGSSTSIWILPLTGDRKPFALVQSQFDNGAAVFSPDCKWLAYASNETGQEEVYITHFPEVTRRYQVSTQGGTLPRWRGDGKELFYFSMPQNSMMAVNVDEKAEALLLGPPRVLFHLANSGIYGPFDATQDGQRFLIVEINSPAGTVPLTLVTNWDVELKKK